MEKTNNLKPHLAILLANLGWGIMAPVSKAVLLSGQISPLALSGIRISGGALLYFIFSWILPTSMQTRQKIDRSDIWRLILCSALIISMNQGLFILGIGMTNPVDSSVMGSLTPILTMIIAAIFLKFPMTWMKVLGVLTGLTGVLLLVMDSGQSDIASNPLLGDTMCLGAQLCAAIYYVAFGRIIQKYSPYTLMKWLFFISVFTYVPFCLPEMMRVDYAALPAEVWWEIAYIITIATFLGYMMIPLAQKSLKPTVVSAYSYLQPVFATIVAVWLGVGDFGWEKAGATLLIFVGIALVNRSSKS